MHKPHITSKPHIEGSVWQKLADSAVTKGIAAVGIALFALHVIGKWDERAEAEIEAKAANAPLQVMNSVKGVRVGEKLAAVVSSHGTFDKETPAPGTVKKYADEEDYVQRKGALRLGVRSGTIFSVGYVCTAGRDRTALNNIACNAGPDRIKGVFLDRVRVLCAKQKPDDPDKATTASLRAYDAVEHGTRYVTVKDSVVGFIVMDPKELESLVGFNWEKCR